MYLVNAQPRESKFPTSLQIRREVNSRTFVFLRVRHVNRIAGTRNLCRSCFVLRVTT